MIIKVSFDDRRVIYDVDIDKGMEIKYNELNDTFLLCFNSNHRQKIEFCKYFRVVGVITDEKE